MYDGFDETDVLALLQRLVAAEDITEFEYQVLISDWESHAVARGEEADYWSLRLLRDLAKAIGSEVSVEGDNIDDFLDDFEAQLVQSLRSDLEAGGGAAFL
jgi:hypothetical protein